MKPIKEFPFDRARRITLREVSAARKALEKKLGIKRKKRGRPPKGRLDKYLAVSIRLHPKIIQWAKREAKRKGTKYQTIINEVLLKVAA